MMTVNLDARFFDNHKIKALAETENGVLKIITWLKLLCFAGQTNDGGRIYRVKGEVLTRPYLASVLGITESQVGEFLVAFKKLRMIYFDQDKCMRLTNWSKWQLNGRRESEESGEKESEKEKSPTPPIKEKVTEKETKEVQEKKENPSPFKNESYFQEIRVIIDYLNQVCKTHFKYNTPKSVICIKARLKEGFSIDDFKTVIDDKYREWSGTEFERYLKPDTLFSNKFEGYLNYAQKETKNSSFDENDFIRNAIERSTR